jgi:hypothetical protein
MPRRKPEPERVLPGPASVPEDGEPFRLDLPQAEELALAARARLRAVQQSAGEQYRRDPYQFLVDCVWTLDQASQQVRRFPDVADDVRCGCESGCKNYLQHLVTRWRHEKRLLVPKSRRVMVTWVMCGLHCWLARFFPGSTIAFVSRKQGLNDSEGAAELVRRVKFIEEHLPVEVAPLEIKYNFARLAYPSIGSEIIGVAQGADQLRQYTLTAIFADEMAYWELASDTYSASLPTLEGGGRFTGVSSANPGFFKMMVHDTV